MQRWGEIATSWTRQSVCLAVGYWTWADLTNACWNRGRLVENVLGCIAFPFSPTPLHICCGLPLCSLPYSSSCCKGNVFLNGTSLCWGRRGACDACGRFLVTVSRQAEVSCREAPAGHCHPSDPCKCDSPLASTGGGLPEREG